MNRPMIKIAAVAMLAACYAASDDAYAANPPRGKFGTQTAVRKQNLHPSATFIYFFWACRFAAAIAFLGAWETNKKGKK